jgi:hypothetical protein
MMKKVVKIWDKNILAEPLHLLVTIERGKVVDWEWCESANQWYAGPSIQDIDVDISRGMAKVYLDDEPWLWVLNIYELEDFDDDILFQC